MRRRQPRSQAVTGKGEESFSTTVSKTSISLTLSTYRNRHELQPRHPQLHGQQETLLAFGYDVWGCHGVLRAEEAGGES